MTDKIPKLPTAPKDVVEYIRRIRFGLGGETLTGDTALLVATHQPEVGRPRADGQTKPVRTRIAGLA
jgi:hypothetical protein